MDGDRDRDRERDGSTRPDPCAMGRRISLRGCSMSLESSNVGAFAAGFVRLWIASEASTAEIPREWLGFIKSFAKTRLCLFELY